MKRVAMGAVGLALLIFGGIIVFMFARTWNMVKSETDVREYVEEIETQESVQSENNLAYEVETVSESTERDDSWMDEYGDNGNSNLGWGETEPAIRYDGVTDIAEYNWTANNLNEVIYDSSYQVFNVDPEKSEFVGIEINNDGNQEIVFTNSEKEYRVIMTMDKLLIKCVHPE